ncbi:MAG: NfuA family Fe-S biogenesis protein [Rhodanobacteraceae bacterium]
MIEVSARAQQHFRQLMEQQGNEDFGILIAVESAGTPAARVDLSFCELDDLSGDEASVACQGFTLHVASGSAEWLGEARIDFEEQRAGGQLRISAPGIRGHAPADDSDLATRARYVIESEINPQLAAHGGQVKLLRIDDDDVAVLEFGGGCHGCGMADVTLKQGVETTLRKHLPAIAGVRDATEHAKGENPYYDDKQGASAMR